MHVINSQSDRYLTQINIGNAVQIAKIKKAYFRKIDKLKNHVAKLKLDFKTQESLFIYALKSKTNLSCKEISLLIFCNSLSRSTLSSKVSCLKKKTKGDILIAKLIFDIESDAYL